MSPPAARRAAGRRPVVALPERVANQIAAGEVVARPASVVKELVENALDAASTRVRVEIEGGGATRIRIVDDGHGMNEADARLSLERHATSKIREVDDLTAIQTFGFRGEALPSIASVSHLLLRTREAQADAGIELRVDGGGPPEVMPCGCAPGTTVEVSDLFYNVPARRKFLRAQSTESAHVTEVVRQIALARPDVTVELVRDGRRKQRWLSAPTRADRVAAVLGNDELTSATGERGPLQIEAYLSAPEQARTGAGGLYLFVCDRPVQDRALARAVAAAYGDLLDKGRYPIGAVFITMPLDLVDVNVHPQKAEVRFAHARAVTDAVYSVVAASLPRPATVGQLARPLGAGPAALHHATSPASPASSWKQRPDEPAREPWTWRTQPGDATPRPLPVHEGEPPPRPAPSSKGVYRHVTEVGPGLMIFESARELAIVSIRQARHAILRRDVDRAWDKGGLAAQRLLFPVVREATPALAARAEHQAEAAARLGFDLRRAGERALAIHAVPRLLSAAAPDRLAEALHEALISLDDGAELGRLVLEPLIDAAVAATRQADPALVARLETDEALVEACAVERLPFDQLEP